MRSQFGTIGSLVVPSGAGAGDARVVIGQDVPAELVTYYAAPFYSMVAFQAVIAYDGSGGYHYTVWLDSPTPGNSFIGQAFGFVDPNLVVYEYQLAFNNFSGSTRRLWIGEADNPNGSTLVRIRDAVNWDVITPLPATPYNPVLTANTTNPTLGTGAVAQGRYTIDPWTGWADVTIRFQFGTAGVAAGTGTYNIELPFAVSLLNDPNDAIRGRSDQLGMGTLRDNSVPASADVIVLAKNAAGGPNGFGQVQMLVVGGAFVASGSPWTWAANDGIDLSIRCRPA